MGAGLAGLSLLQALFGNLRGRTAWIAGHQFFQAAGGADIVVAGLLGTGQAEQGVRCTVVVGPLTGYLA
jgi:hypothetical protein